MTAEARIRVLLVDDHEVVRRGLHAFLDSEPDLEVVGDASGGEEALELYAQLAAEGRQPDVVLMDLKMAPLDGIETTRRIRKRHPGSQVVALTSYGEHERVNAALAAGASGYLLKDADPDEITAAVKAAHRGELSLDAAVTRPLLASLREEPEESVTSKLTMREREVLQLLVAGKSNKQIAADLVISERTARTHVSSVLKKVGVSSRTQAALLGQREGLAPAAEQSEETS